MLENTLQEFDQGIVFQQEVIDNFEEVLEQAKEIKSIYIHIYIYIYIIDDALGFSAKAYDYEISRFVWFWLHLFITIIAIVMGLCGFIPCKSTKYLVASMVILFWTFAVLFLYIAYTTSEIFIILDVCEQVNKYNLRINNKCRYTVL